ncbi:hypothetical protein M1116_01895 [Patescibacteria group bacterium]|nr:hypothetical protein [Patescibacteria group bacterium]
MNFPKEAVIQFKEIYERKFGEVLSFEEAEVRAINFLELMALITGLPKR